MLVRTWPRLATSVLERAREPLPAGEARFFVGLALLRLCEVEAVAAEAADPGLGFHLFGAVRTGLLSQSPASRSRRRQGIGAARAATPNVALNRLPDDPPH